MKGSGFVLAAICLLALAIRIVFFSGIEYSDDLKYASDAFELMAGPFKIQDCYWRVRMGLLFPVALSCRFFGVSISSLVLYPLLCSLALVIVTYNLGKLFFSEKTGLLAAFFLALFPLDAEYATKVMPDVPVAFWMALGALVFFNAFFSLREKTPRPEKSPGRFFLAGVIFGVAYLVRDTGALMIPFICIALTIDLVARSPGPSLKEAIIQRLAICLAMIAGFLVVFCLEGVYYLMESGNFFQRYLIVTRFFSECGGIKQDLTFFPRSLFHLESQWRFAREDIYYPFGFFYYAIFPALTLALLLRLRKTWLLSSWFLFLLCYHQFGSMSLTHYVLIHRLARHLTVITVPALLILSYMILELYSWEKKNRAPSYPAQAIAIAVLCMISISSLWSIAMVNRYNRALTFDAIGCYDIVKNYPDTRVYADISTSMHMSLLDGFRHPGRFKPYQDLEFAKPSEKKIVILDSFRICIDNPERFQRLIPPLYRKPSSSWFLLGEVDGPRYDVWAEFNPRIYLLEGTRFPE